MVRLVSATERAEHSLIETVLYVLLLFTKNQQCCARGEGGGKPLVTCEFRISVAPTVAAVAVVVQP